MKPSSSVLNPMLNPSLNSAETVDLSRLNLPSSVRFVLKLLRKINVGSLTLRLPDGQQIVFGQPYDTREQVPHANLALNNWKVFGAVAKSGDIGFAEGYMNQDWTTPDLAALLKLFVANREQLESAVYGSWLGQLGYRIKHWFNRNTKAQARKNIHAHYDLGNAFYELWLDPSMTYSCALFSEPHLTLEQAQYQKYRRALSELRLHQASRLLEIGFGWGGMAQVATAAGHQVTGLTLSTEQLKWSKTRLGKLGLAHRADFRLQDYREVDEQFDAIVSIEMFEAVGQAYWNDYFTCLQRNLKPGGYACIQSITIAEALFERYQSGTDFIQQYIFPGGMLPTVEAFESLARSHGLEVIQTYRFGQDYAETLKRWRERFMGQLESVYKLGFDSRFVRTWEFYLAYCEAAFTYHNTDVVQFTLRKLK